jgi:nucleoside-diphosphate-sugar epimerase
MAIYRVLGSDGFIGSNLCLHLRSVGHTVETSPRDQAGLGGRGHIMFCIGLTADFRSRPFDTVEAHVDVLRRALQAGGFESFTYLSSTRVYQHLPIDEVALETSNLTVNPNDPSDLYNLSKLTGEALCLSSNDPTVRVARISNVYGGSDTSQNFLTSILDDALRKRQVVFGNGWNAAKDYIGIEDVVLALERLPLRGKSRLFNLACGRNVTNSELGKLVQEHIDCTVQAAGSNGPVFPIISIERLKAQLDIVPEPLSKRFPHLASSRRTILGKVLP